MHAWVWKVMLCSPVTIIILLTRNTCMQRPLAYIFQTLFQQHEVFVIMPTLNAGSRCHVMLVMATR
jgi:hypothetical protein